MSWALLEAWVRRCDPEVSIEITIGGMDNARDLHVEVTASIADVIEDGGYVSSSWTGIVDESERPDGEPQCLPLALERAASEVVERMREHPYPHPDSWLAGNSAMTRSWIDYEEPPSEGAPNRPVES